MPRTQDRKFGFVVGGERRQVIQCPDEVSGNPLDARLRCRQKATVEGKSAMEVRGPHPTALPESRGIRRHSG